MSAPLHEQTSHLLKKLHEGYVLCRIHDKKYAYKEYLISQEIGQYEIKGWGTVFGSWKDRMMELITNPENWKVLKFNHRKQDYPYPWSSTFNSNKHSNNIF